ncbi:Protein TIC 40, chloroplastic [Gossypium arboreum]|uniref:Protein TIC 40, chloroplastic n=1 Tax=Gossypium arboreum TaxID=29729 RepID=A0A0B0NZ94_GOSAR|nr:Protein TIC 40, chloroplastic [Gossypium arboreum]
MENLNMALVSSSSLSYSSPPKLFPLGYNNPNYTLKNPTKTFLYRTSKIAPRSSRIPNSAHASPLPPLHPQIESITMRGLRAFLLPAINRLLKLESTLIPLCLRHPLECIGLAALFTWKYVMQQAFKTMTGQMNTQNNQFGNTVFPLGSPFPFPAPPSAGPDIPRSPSSQCTDTVDAPVRQVEAASVTDPATEVKSVKNETETAEPKKYAFVDVSPKETMHKSAFEDAAELSSPNGIQSSKDLSDNGAASKQDAGAFGGFQASGGAGPTLSVDALEKMLEDPTVQKMVYP